MKKTKQIENNAKIYQVKTKTIYADEKSNLKPIAVILPFSIYYLQQIFKKLFLLFKLTFDNVV